MAFVVIYDASVLYPAPLRDLLLRLARTGLFQARWTDQILDECFAALQRQRPDLAPDRLARTRQLMVQAVPDCLVEGYQPLIDGLHLPDPDDRHVLAAAIRAGSQVIVTTNLRDFPAEQLSPYDIEAQSADEFVTELLSLAPDVVAATVREQAANLKQPPQTLEQLLDTLEKSIPLTVREIRRHIASE